MEKQLIYNSIEEDRKTLHLVRNGGSLIKVADANEWLPEIKKFVENMTPKEDHIYTLCNALGAGEYWSSNVNGDYFPERALQNYHDTFTNATPFMMHINKDPKKGYGEVLFSAYNPHMHRVELVVGYDRNKLPEKYIKKIENDENVNLSMGCRVPYDVCSICGNVAPTPAQYCDCIKRYGLNHVFDDGRKLYVINTEPDFFDISIVIVPADKTARILSRIDVPSISSQPKEKTAAVSSPKVDASENLIDLLPEVSYSLLEDIAHNTKTAECLIASVKHAQKYLKPYEVQAILCIQQGHDKLAKLLHSKKIYFEGEVTAAVDKKAAAVSLHKLQNRLKNIKQAMSDNIANGDVTPSMSYDVRTLSGEHGMLSQLTAIANLSALAGLVMGKDINNWIPLLLSGANLGNMALSSAIAPQESLPPQEDLMLAPLVYAKKASALSITEIYLAPILSQMSQDDTHWEKVAGDVIKEGALKLIAKKIIKDKCALDNLTQ